jgi:hypothetical protein
LGVLPRAFLFFPADIEAAYIKQIEYIVYLSERVFFP